MHVCVFVYVNMHVCALCACVCVCEYGCVCWAHPLFFADLYWFSCIEDPDLCFLSFLHCCFSSVGRQLKCQAFSDVCPLVQYGKGDMSGGGGVKWDSIPTALLQERSTNALECQVLISLICGVTEQCRAGAGVQSGTYCQIQIFSEFDYWCSSTGKG